MRLRRRRIASRTDGVGEPRVRRRSLSAVAVALVLYGAFGISLLSIGAVQLAGPLGELENVTRSLDDQRSALLRALTATSETITDAARGVDNMDESLEEARTATDSAAALAREVSGTMFNVAGSMDVVVLGSRPFQGVAASFGRAGSQLEALAGNVSSIAEALGQNREDLQSVALSLRDVGRRVDSLATAVESGPSPDVSAPAISAIRLGVYALLAWLFALALGCLGAGLWLWSFAGRP